MYLLVHLFGFMIELDIILLVLVAISVAEFSIQVVISELSQWLKDKTALSQPYQLSSLGKFRFWFSLLRGWFWVLSPLVLVLVVLANCHRFISSLTACPWCLAFWLAIAANYFFLGLPIITAVILAPLTLAFVTILNKIHSW